MLSIRESPALRGEKGFEGTPKGYAGRLVQPSCPLTRFDWIDSILSLLAALCCRLPGICKLDLCQRTQAHLSLTSADAVTKKPTLVELSPRRPRDLQIEAASVGMHAHFGVSDLEG
jgi:hypothetical protein